MSRNNFPEYPHITHINGHVYHLISRSDDGSQIVADGIVDAEKRGFVKGSAILSADEIREYRGDCRYYVYYASRNLSYGEVWYSWPDALAQVDKMVLNHEQYAPTKHDADVTIYAGEGDERKVLYRIRWIKD